MQLQLLVMSYLKKYSSSPLSNKASVSPLLAGLQEALVKQLYEALYLHPIIPADMMK